ncbi:ARF guanine-nucleotide exchange factor GNL2-like [Trifolium medium]|uniref:ARF guanine-nucleotide exchange factor GNL2-like n=1 Tax=Trifolium medium TaxID=97028 RepID=A0A392PPF7_9FABA|nr:ARF guanine-nucleotide exchange factor GNL2-like [Trifolium medium]
MHELIQAVFSRLPEIEVYDREGDSESDIEEEEDDDDEDDDDDIGHLESGYGIRSAIDIFQFLCSLLNVVSIVEADGSTTHTADEDVQIFALVLINSAIELSGDKIGNHPKLLRMHRFECLSLPAKEHSFPTRSILWTCANKNCNSRNHNAATRSCS